MPLIEQNTSPDNSEPNAAPAAAVVTASEQAVSAAGARLEHGRAKSRKAKTASAAKPAGKADTKAAVVLKKLRSAKGASIVQLCEATGWQPHSVRGFLSATVRKKLGLALTSKVGKDGIRRYRIGSGVDAAVAEVTS